MSKEIKCIYPEDELVKLTKEDVGTTLYCNSFYNGKKLGGLLVVCNKSLIKKLNLSFDKDTHICQSLFLEWLKSNNLFLKNICLNLICYCMEKKRILNFI